VLERLDQAQRLRGAAVVHTPHARVIIIEWSEHGA
jgi:hypothetical protein